VSPRRDVASDRAIEGSSDAWLTGSCCVADSSADVARLLESGRALAIRLTASRSIVTRGYVVRLWSLMLFGLYLAAARPVVAQPANGASVPETFGAKAQAENAAGVSVSAPTVIRIERYTPEFDRNAVLEGLRVGGYPGFISALRKAPDVGYVQVGGRKATIRWARETSSETGRTIVLVTDKPIAFVTAPGDAKSRAGYQVALIRLTVDARGTGSGTMAAAARVKAGGETGVQVDDFAGDTPVVLSAATRK
jgi:hypothetical protein